MLLELCFDFRIINIFRNCLLVGFGISEILREESTLHWATITTNTNTYQLKLKYSDFLKNKLTT